MSELSILTTQLAAGAMLGVFFFGGLWITVKRALSSDRPALIFLGSLALRTCIVMLGFYYVSGRHWQGFLACISGFMIVRLISTRLKLPVDKPATLSKETGHAP